MHWFLKDKTYHLKSGYEVMKLILSSIIVMKVFKPYGIPIYNDLHTILKYEKWSTMMIYIVSIKLTSSKVIVYQFINYTIMFKLSDTILEYQKQSRYITSKLIN